MTTPKMPGWTQSPAEIMDTTKFCFRNLVAVVNHDDVAVLYFRECMLHKESLEGPSGMDLLLRGALQTVHQHMCASQYCSSCWNDNHNSWLTKSASFWQLTESDILAAYVEMAKHI